MALTKRNISYKHSDTPLTSKRARIILSSSEDSKKLAKAIRANRHNHSESFKVSATTATRLAK